MINPEPSTRVGDETAGSGEKRGRVCERKSKRDRKKNGFLEPSVPGDLFHLISAWVLLYVLVRHPCQRAAFWLACSL